MVMKRPMVAFLTQLLLAIRSRFAERVRLEAENLRGLLIKVRMNDGASCRFGAVAQERGEMRGVCICNEVGGKPERGWWQVRRAY
jgi:hypothetical protein